MDTDINQQDHDKAMAIAYALIGGGLLVLLSQFVMHERPHEERWQVTVLTVIGAGFFAVGLWQSQTTHRLAGKRLLQAADFFGVHVGQVVLLVLAACFAVLTRLAAGSGLMAWHAWAALLSWALAWTCVIAGSNRNGRGRIGRLATWEIGLLAALFIAALALRNYNIAGIPTTLAGDEASAGLSAITWLNGEANNLFSMGWFSFPSLFYALQSVSIGLIGRNIEALRLLSAFAGAFTVVGLYLLARSLFGQLTAFLAAACLVANHFHVHFSRIGLQNIWDGLFLVIAFGGLWHGWKKGWRGGFIICGIALGLGQYFYVGFRIVPLLVIIWSISAAIVQFDTFKKRLPDLILSVYTALIIYLPLALFYIENPVDFNAPLERVTIFNGWLDQMVHATGRAEWSIILQQAWQAAQGITHLPLQHWYPAGEPLLLAGAAGLFLLGLLISVLRFDLRYWLVLLPLLGVIAISALSMDVPAAQRYVLAAPSVAILVALPLAETAKWVARAWPQFRPIAITTAIIIIAMLMVFDIDFYFNESADNYYLGGGNAYTAMYIVDYLEQQQNPHPIVYFFGWPRMGYLSISSIPYLAPYAEGIDVNEPLNQPPDWELTGETAFLFLPERISDLTWIEKAYPGGIMTSWLDEKEDLQFIVYTVSTTQAGS
ncbi:MAG: glycosyltransferase family 39 protein [Anaerolineae bacterium]|nr:glycosyltransferase family 39 protein [Anaerolineae bacterium]